VGLYHHELMGRNYDRIQIVTIQELIEQDKWLDLPMSHEAIKSAKQKDKEEQIKWDL
jgi:hypothetical protein